MFTCTHARMHSHTHVCTYVRKHACSHTRMHLTLMCTHVRTHVFRARYGRFSAADVDQYVAFRTPLFDARLNLLSMAKKIARAARRAAGSQGRQGSAKGIRKGGAKGIRKGGTSTQGDYYCPGALRLRKMAKAPLKFT